MIYFFIETGNLTDFFRDCPRKKKRDEIGARVYVSCVLMLIAKSFEPIKNNFLCVVREQENWALCVCGGGRGAKLKINRRFLFILRLQPDCAGKALLRLAASSSRAPNWSFCVTLLQSPSLGNWHRLRYRCVHASWRRRKALFGQFVFTFMFTRFEICVVWHNISLVPIDRVMFAFGNICE